MLQIAGLCPGLDVVIRTVAAPPSEKHVSDDGEENEDRGPGDGETYRHDDHIWPGIRL